MLKETFIKLTQKYCTYKTLIEKLWVEIEKNYSSSKRHYHTLVHLQHLLTQLRNVESAIKNLDAVLFALYYHDIIYDPLKTNNEQKSAALAAERLKQISVPENLIQTCCAHIHATQKHLPAADSDTNYFTDADLSILGAGQGQYMEYVSQIRKEYSIYPDLIYNPGRKKVLLHFLNMPRIYKTDYFHERFEKQAKENLGAELELFS